MDVLRLVEQRAGGVVALRGLVVRRLGVVGVAAQRGYAVLELLLLVLRLG